MIGWQKALALSCGELREEPLGWEAIGSRPTRERVGWRTGAGWRWNSDARGCDFGTGSE